MTLEEFTQEKNSFMLYLFAYNIKVSKGAKIRNRYNQVPHLTQDTNGKASSKMRLEFFFFNFSSAILRNLEGIIFKTMQWFS